MFTQDYRLVEVQQCGAGMGSSRIRYLLWAVILLITSPCVASSQSAKHVLILNSYHHGYKWTDELSNGVITELEKSSGQVKHYLEYMGTKWTFDKDYLNRLPDIYRHKFKNIAFDLIVATDDDAFSFLLKHRDTVFGNIPVVFCGVNWFDKRRLINHHGFTGINEDADIVDNLDLMLRLHPDTKDVYMVVDQTTTGRIVHRQIQDIIPVYKDRIKIHLLDDLDLSQLYATVSHLPDDSLVFLTIFQQDRSGEFIEFNEIARQLSERSRVPVYGMWDFYLGFGIVGGMLTSGEAQGQSAGILGSRILAGESPDAIPVIMQSPNRYRFDFLQLKRFDIKRAKLPSGSELINEPSSSYTFSKDTVWAATIFSFLVMLVTILLAININRRAKAELALREIDAKYHTLVDNISIGVYRTSAEHNGRILQANPAMVRIFGYDSIEELSHKTVSDLYLNPDERNLFLKDLHSRGVISDRELLMKKKDGTPIWVLSNATAVYDEKNQLKWIDGVNEDITEKKQLEEQLRQAQKMEAIGTLAGGIAHDFNNILTAIIGYGSLLKIKKADDQDILHYLTPILGSAEKAVQLTQSLLAFSRKQIINLKPVDINEIVEGMGSLLLRLIGEDIELQIDNSGGRLMALADRGQVEQVLMNLVANARDAMPEGGTISVETDRILLTEELLVRHEFMRPGNYAVLSVSDTGNGIDEETRARIFEPFFSTKEIGKGTGLGLSIVYGIVKQHNGDISVYSEPGKGTTLKIYLPLVENEIKEEEEKDHKLPIEGGHEMILIGEDNDEVRHLAADILSMAGYRVIQAIDGDDVMEKFHRYCDEVDLLLLDVVMPKKNGKEVFDAVGPSRPDLKVLFMSGYTANIIHKKGVLNEGLNFIAKPLSPDRLLAKIREVLSHRPLLQGQAKKDLQSK